ncbi:stabilin-1-like protein [Labeo rohita]|uniref:Stabilin-1-like protein n=1 Tax=Labeo rohita TaxID=84645 RepID=A0A498NFK9_LABRO|nr:stabilin-1-like protein [Labeo rohita]
MAVSNRCDAPITVLHRTPCTSCAASAAVVCPRGFRKINQNPNICKCVIIQLALVRQERYVMVMVHVNLKMAPVFVMLVPIHHRFYSVLGVCSPGICDANAKCSFSGGKFQCECEEGFRGDGKHCVPINPCDTNNGGCTVESTACEFTSPGKSKCVCLPGMESSDPSKGCTQKSACTPGSCHVSAHCETNSDGTPSCRCNAQQIGDGRRCYGNLMERVLELDREGSQAGNLTGSVRFFEQACEFTLSQHGPFTAFIPVGQNSFQHFILMRDPDVLFTILESDIPASNGIIHIIDKPFTLAHVESSDNNMEFSSKTIGEIFREDDRFNRFLSLVDNCGALLPVRGSGPLTVFAPTNTAIDKSRDGSLMYMLNDVTVDQLASMSEITTMANEVLRINVSEDGRVFLGDKGIPLETKDIVASNGIIHLVDGLLVPSSIVPIMPHRCDINGSRISLAGCIYDAGKVSCVCMEGWTGDGRLCVGINSCMSETRGGCHENAECIATGPGQNDCRCRKGFMGDGIVCKVVNPCLSDNGGCHSLATCKMKSPGIRECVCRSEYEGDGLTCYGNMLVELDGNSEFYHFNRFLLRHKVIDSDSRVTALVPSKAAFRNLSDSEESFWFDYYRLPHLLQVHFLDGIYTSEDLQQLVGKTVQTIGKTKWEVQSNGRELMIGNATILAPDLKAINGCIHIIDTILRPPLSDFPPPPPSLMTLLNNTPEFSLFRQAALLYNLENSIPTRDYTILIPSDNAIQEYLKKTNLTQLSLDIVKYHIILGEQLFREHLGNGLFKNTFLGNGTQIMFFVDIDNQTMANDVPMNGSFNETRHGTAFGIPRVLDLHKNHCSKDIILKISGRCGDCNAEPKCLYNAKPVQPKYPQNMKSNCKYRTRVGKKRVSVPGCHIDCLRTTKDHSCCPGYFGHDCSKCPGTVDNWCSNNGQCKDGLFGSGECLCNEGFHGTACEMCEPGRYGKDCKSGHRCLAINPCRKDNGGCSVNAYCKYLGDGERNCSCYIGYKGDGFKCAGTVSRELLRMPEAEWLRRNVGVMRVRDLYSQGPFTVFVPHADYVANVSTLQVEKWKNSSHSPDLLRYHIVSCEELRESDLKSVKEVVTSSGYKLRFSVRDGVVYINDNTKIITSDVECSNGVIHFIDKILFPYDLTGKADISTDLNITAAAEQYGFKIFSKLLQDGELMHVLQHRPFYPFTMFWPTDEVFNNLPEDRKKWLYSEDHRDKLQAYLKAHIVRDQRVVAVALPSEKSMETLFGSELTFSCNKELIGDILINGNNARIVARNMLFDSGIAHGIDQLLEPPGIGARCDNFTSIEVKNRTSICRRPYSPYMYRRPSYYGLYSYGYGYNSYRDWLGCNRICTKMMWSVKCCKNHFGRDCQVCPGGLEAPCGMHGDCSDGQTGTGICKCHKGFTGTACELCESNHFGPNCTACNCTSNGKCDSGMDSDGSCFCQEGWKGKYCESKIEVKPICSPVCDLNAVCLPENQCECVPPYTGNGINCTAPDLCSEYNGGCHEEADCLQTGINVNCSCRSGYTGDGHVCSPINLCVEEANGGCSDFAECIFSGPNERRCVCLEGYVGNGIQCLEKVVPPVDRCLEGNGGCDPKATCKDLHFHTKTAGVFHLRSPEGKYKMNYTKAQEACEAEGATLATFKQLSDAQQLGMHLCVAGWMDEKKAGYPIRFPSAKCGDNHVGIVVYKEPVNASWPYDAYCYRMSEVSCECRLGYVGSGEFCNGDLASVVASTSNFSVFYTTLLKYAEDGEEGKNLLKSLSDKSLNITVFVPHNDGFSVNKTLSWRDLQYHIARVNGLHYYEDLKHKAVIPSRLGSDIVVTIPSNSTGQAEDSQPQKLVNNKVILAWNIPAINGLIHVIDGPFRAPPAPVPAVSPISQSSSVAITTVLIVFAIVGIVAGLAYYILKHKNDAFRFQYFKNWPSTKTTCPEQTSQRPSGATERRMPAPKRVAVLSIIQQSEVSNAKHSSSNAKE